MLTADWKVRYIFLIFFYELFRGFDDGVIQTADEMPGNIER